MSSQFNNKNKFSANANTNSRKPFCKVCADAGKTDTAHFPRRTPDLNSEVVCPTLKALECRYCFKNGHTVKYCPVLKERNERDDRDRRDRERHEREFEKERQARVQVVEKKSQSTSKFAALLEEEEEEERIEVTRQTVEAQFVAKREIDFPSIFSKNVEIKSLGNKWSSMAANAAQLPIPKPKIVEKPVVEEKITVNSRWAEDSDDEYVEDYDDEYEEVVSAPVSTLAAPVAAPAYEYVWPKVYDCADDEW